jgi:hypothetical protein
MRLRNLALMTVGLAASATGFAADEPGVRAPLHSYSSAAPPSVAPKSAVFMRTPEMALPDLGGQLGQVSPMSRGGGCRSLEIEVCLDSTGRINVPGAKRFLPEIEGLKPEQLTVRRGGVLFHYSF